MIHSQLRFAVFEQLLEKALVFNLEEREGGQSHWFAACSLGICARNVPVALRLQQQLWLSDDGSSRAARAPSARQRGPPFQINPAQKFSTTPSALHPLLLCPATLPIGSACGPLLTVLARTVEAYPAQFALAGAGGCGRSSFRGRATTRSVITGPTTAVCDCDHDPIRNHLGRDQAAGPRFKETSKFKQRLHKPSQLKTESQCADAF